MPWSSTRESKLQRSEMGGRSRRINSYAHAKLDHSKINARHHDNNLHITAIWNLLIKGRNSGWEARHLHYLMCSQRHRFMVHLPARGTVCTLERREDQSLCALWTNVAVKKLQKYAAVWGGGYCGSIWASLVARLVKNLPAMRETWVQSLGWEDSPEKGKATHVSILVWRVPWTV